MAVNLLNQCVGGGGGQLTSGSRICIDIGRFESNSRLELPLVADVYHQDMG